MSMEHGVAVDMGDRLAQAMNRYSTEELTGHYRAQGEVLTLPSFLPESAIADMMREVEAMRPRINRNYIPGHKKGGSISYYIVKECAPTLHALYGDRAFMEWLSTLSSVQLQRCPEDDPHACALYFYTEPGDHIGFHYDTSYYRGARYTVLIGLVDRSTSHLLCELHTRDATRDTEKLALQTAPGSFVFFNGDSLYHAVSPLGQNEERIVLTLQYVTDPNMGTAQRWFSNMKDAVGYFGLSALVRRT